VVAHGGLKERQRSGCEFVGFEEADFVFAVSRMLALRWKWYSRCRSWTLETHVSSARGFANSSWIFASVVVVVAIVESGSYRWA
jgi:hypothetical protein